MTFRRTGRLGMTFVGIACWVLVWSQAVQAQVKLEHKYTEGQKLTYKTTSKTHQVLTLMGMDIESNEERSVITSVTAGKRRSDSTLPLERKVESFRAELSLPGGKNLTFDTADPNAKIDDQNFAFLADIFKFAGEVVYTIVVDEHNQVKAIEGTEKLKEKAEHSHRQVEIC